MPLQDRKPKNLPHLLLPNSLGSTFREGMHTPLPSTPMPYQFVQHGAMVMTPDTPAFEISPFQTKDSAGGELDWTEDEDGMVQSYLAHPPRPISVSYPPGQLPPHYALDEITTQLMDRETTRPSAGTTWRHSWKDTRLRLFTIARMESMGVTGGHRRDPATSMLISDIAKALGVPVGAQAPSVRPKLTALGSSTMNRKQDSMDNISGDEAPSGFQEALRLSGNLQDTASKDSGSVLTSGDGLSSPLAFTFNFAPSVSARKPSFPNTNGHMPRPTSLLQRGRSFTSEEVMRESATEPKIEEEVVDISIDESPARRVPMTRSASSPVSSTFTSSPSPPSSTSSQSLVMEDVEEDPFTPVNQTFPAGINPAHRVCPSAPSAGPSWRTALPVWGDCPSDCSCNRSTPLAASAVRRPNPGAATPSITVTADSPTRPSSVASLDRERDNTTPTPGRGNERPSDSADAAVAALAALSLQTIRNPTLEPKPTNAFRGPSILKKTAGFSSTRPAPMSRSFSDLTPFTSSSAFLPSSSSTNAIANVLADFRSIPAPAPAPAHSARGPVIGQARPLPFANLFSERDGKRQRVATGLNLPKGPGPALKVDVPQRDAVIVEELRSPFELKPITLGSIKST